MFFSISRTAVVLAALFVSTPAFALLGSPGAEIIQIAAVTFTPRAAASSIGDDNAGTMTNAVGKFYAAVPFATNGWRVCRFVLIHRDNDSDAGITARLLKKIVVPGGSPFDSPVEMAKVTTGANGTTQFVAAKNDVTIRQPVLDLGNAFYYVELEFGNQFLEALGVQIEANETCAR
jgi:hypothetical protein